MKRTGIAPSNIAFIKYWGKRDEALRIPENSSISMDLDSLITTTTVEFSDRYARDEVIIDGARKEEEAKRALEHIDRIRHLAGISLRAKVLSKNNFPSGTGLSSSASGFAALTIAASAAAGLDLSEKKLSILARQGSGSACRSIPSGFVEWVAGASDETSYAYSIYPQDYWDIADVVAIVSSEKKDIPTSEGQKIAGTSPFYSKRLELIGKKTSLIKRLIKDRDFTSFGSEIENEALELHAIMLTSRPPLIYWLPNTVLLMKHVRKWRSAGLEAYFTINTGQDVHIICRRQDTERVAGKLKELGIVKDIMISSPGSGARLVESHLF